MKAQTKAIILARVSSKSQEDEGYSLDSQLKLMRDYCKSKKLNIVYEFKIAETASKDQRRKIYQEMLGYITKHRVFNVVVEKTDRLTRNFKDATMIDAWLEKDERRMLHMVKENLLLHKEARSDAKFMWNIYLSVAKKYTDNLREEAMKGWAEKLAQGWLPATPPPGYKTVVEHGKKIHIPDAEVAPNIARAFGLAKLSDYSVVRITEVLAEMGVTSRSGRPYAKSYVYKILTNPFYIGINRFDGKEYPGAQEPIISKDLFYEVQDKIHGRHSSRSIKHNSIFKGVIRCVDCDSMVTWQKQKNRYYGICRRLSEQCKGRPMLREDRVEEQVIGELDGIQDGNGKLLKEIEGALNITQPERVNAYRQGIIKTLNMKLGRLRTMKETLYEDRLADLISSEKYKSKVEDLAQQSEHIMSRLAKLQEIETELQAKSLLKEASKIVDLYIQCTPSQKRIVLALTLKEIVVHNGELVLEPRR